MTNERLAETFPGVIDEDSYVLNTSAVLNALGFTHENTLASIGVCREQLSRPLELGLMQNWGASFSFTSLGGVLTVGRTGFKALLKYAPDEFDRKRYAFFQYTLIGLSPDGVVGDCQLPGHSGLSKACDALYLYADDLQDGIVDYQIYDGDKEYGIMMRRLRKQLPQGPAPDLLTVTKAAHDASQEDLEKLIAGFLKGDEADWSVMTGIQVCAPDGMYMWPGESYAMIDGQRQELAVV